MVRREDYLRGFEDAVTLVEHYLLKYNDTKKALLKIKELKDALIDKKIDFIRMELQILE